jgi:processive 1,2-diacylglycerol beta-glucosyltransferase
VGRDLSRPIDVEETPMVKLYDSDSGAELGTISRQQLQLLLDHLEEESDEDQDYYLNRATLDYLEGSGADPELVRLLKTALDEREDLEIRWSDV